MTSWLKKHAIFIVLIGLWIITLSRTYPGTFDNVQQATHMGFYLELTALCLIILLYLIFQGPIRYQHATHRARLKDTFLHRQIAPVLAPCGGTILYQPADCRHVEQQQALAQLKQAAALCHLDIVINLVASPKPYLALQQQSQQMVELTVTEATVKRHGWATLVPRIAQLLVVRDFDSSNVIAKPNEPTPSRYIFNLGPVTALWLALTGKWVIRRRLKKLSAHFGSPTCRNLTKLNTQLNAFLTKENGHWQE
ncbi:hypothetical protein GCM10023333_14570 [Ferrimonas pelagia]|uniref:Uncharacterized protein n=2 Tax=Ferrimonas pelagia TaxID=1177826 RepID=A0ABP9EL47_9GAMM